MRPLSGKLGALRERDFRLLFTATTITTLGDRIAAIALVFAVLAIGSGSRSSSSRSPSMRSRGSAPTTRSARSC